VSAPAVANFIGALQFPPESARASGRQRAAFIRQQATKAGPELTSWTVALVSNSQAEPDKQRTLAGHDIGLVKRTPESQKPDSFALRKANILSPLDESLDLASLFAADVALAESRTKPGLAAELDACQPDHSKSMRDLALAITRSRIAAGRLKGSPTTDVPNGRVGREVRAKRQGLLLIYPLVAPASVPGADGRPDEPTGLDPAGPPSIGVALSFPTSDTVLGVEYRVNRVWGAEMQEDAAYDD
jgi:hypothetical protein